MQSIIQQANNLVSLSATAEHADDQEQTYTKIQLSPDSGVLHPDGRRVFYPGSSISGTVIFHVHERLRAQHLKLILRSSERLEYGATGWSQSRVAPQHTFAVKTHLWGLRQKESNPNKWPLLTPGTYQFPFSCELPMINYNLTFHHQSYASYFSLQTAVVRATEAAPEFTDMCPIEFMPFVATSTCKEVHTECKSADHVTGEIIMPETGFLAGETAALQLRLLPQSPCAPHKVLSVQAKLRQIISVGYEGYFRMERNDVATSKPSAPENLPATMSMELCIPKTALPTIDYSLHIKIMYQLQVTVHLKGNSLFRHKLKFIIPINIGTLGRGISPPRELLAYSDREVLNEPGMRFKPRFLLAEENHDDELPAYDSENSPPSYEQEIAA